MSGIAIHDLSERIDLVPLLASWHFKQWSDLTGASSESDYREMLARSGGGNLPMTLIALSNDNLLGSVNIVKCDMEIRPELRPWLAQLHVDPPQRGRGIGSALVHAAAERSRLFGFRKLYLYTSGTLPAFYESIGWRRREAVRYKGKDRIVMEMMLQG